MPVALLLALGAVALISGETITDDLSDRASLVAAAGAVALVGVIALTVLFVRGRAGSRSRSSSRCRSGSRSRPATTTPRACCCRSTA